VLSVYVGLDPHKVLAVVSTFGGSNLNDNGFHGFSAHPDVEGSAMKDDRVPVHSIRMIDSDWARLDDLFEEGASWVRRHTRAWPSGHDLLPQVRKDGDVDYIDFFFVARSDAPLF
jgi:hypothetical protein